MLNWIPFTVHAGSITIRKFTSGLMVREDVICFFQWLTIATAVMKGLFLAFIAVSGNTLHRHLWLPRISLNLLRKETILEDGFHWCKFYFRWSNA